MRCNEVQWSATSCNKMVKRIVLSTKQLGCRWRKSFTTFFAKNHKFTNLPFNALLYLI